ncbi:STAS domain-containing protein [Cellulomonas sp. IC4_254]|uniref:STAS domain-containing protein n=1 Tax=Cellulomonas sp. IC4_254 TaxID=2714040 RepID=UPI001423B6EE|nr:STAS domain-containing protein [Cellulomonas sp. IC4_254]NHT17466.1 STAS domain-containing protein [Cellulomonas sp. IC4_254]
MDSLITVQDHDGTTVVRLVGEIDLALRDDASRALGHALTAGAPVVVDLADVAYIDSAGIAFLVQCRRACQQVGLSCSIRNLPARAADVVELAGLAEVLGVS